MLNLDRVTLICADTLHIGDAIISMRKSMEKVIFAKCVFLTNVQLNLPGIDVIKIPTLKSKQDYSKFIIQELYKYFHTEFCLIVQHDSWVLSAEEWQSKFYDFDILGAAWLYPDDRNNSNGGFSLRSHKLQKIIATDPFIEMYDPEDEVLGRLYRQYLTEKHSIKYPTDDVCDEFAFELRSPFQKTFGFHGNFHKPYKPYVIIERHAAFGDVITLEPVLEHFYNKGYNVVLDTLPQFRLIFSQHYFPILFPEQVDPRILETATRYNLDGSYESKPKQLHLKTYFEFCDVPEEEMIIRNPKLSLGFDITVPSNRLIKNKYAILHIDGREQAHRNIYGADWLQVVKELQTRGYEVYKVGKDDHSDLLGVPKINTINEQLLAYVVAGASLMIGIDSGISHVASGFNVPSILFFGSVNPEHIHADLSNKIIIRNVGVCDKPHCWSLTTGTAGQDCYIDNQRPPCTQFTTEQVIEAINKLT